MTHGGRDRVLVFAFTLSIGLLGAAALAAELHHLLKPLGRMFG